MIVSPTHHATTPTPLSRVASAADMYNSNKIPHQKQHRRNEAYHPWVVVVFLSLLIFGLSLFSLKCSKPSNTLISYISIILTLVHVLFSWFMYHSHLWTVLVFFALFLCIFLFFILCIFFNTTTEFYILRFDVFVFWLS